MKTKSKSTIIIIIAGVLALAAVAAVIGVFLSGKGGRSTANDDTVTTTTRAEFNDDDWGNTISYKGETYKKNKDLTTVLFMGVDDGASVSAGATIGNNGRCDAIILFVMNDREKTIRMLELSRNTMANVDAYNDERRIVFSGPMQINMQYAFSDSDARGCHIMKNKVSEVLQGIAIDNYCSLTMDGIAVIVDYLGGVTITMEEDCTDIDPAYSEGAVVEMDGEMAERFVRYRDITVTGSNENSRMSRQAWFIRQFFRQMRGMSRTQMVSLMDEAEEYLETDMYAETLAGFLKYDLEGDTLVAPGHVEENVHDEFYLDQEALSGMLVELLYLKEQ